MAERYNNIIEFDEISSTNDYANEFVAQQFVPDFTIIRTNFQTKGRGQIGNCWTSNKGDNLLFSIVLHPNCLRANNQFILSQSISLALQETVSKFCKNVSIKWPNDIYVNDKKIAGILIENTLIGKQIETTIVGIGLNVNQTHFEGLPNPTSVLLEYAKEHTIDSFSFNLNELLSDFLNLFKVYYAESQKNPQSISLKYFQHLYLLKTIHTYEDATGIFEGYISDVAPDGRLQIIDTEGKERWYYFKEVSFVSD